MIYHTIAPCAELRDIVSHFWEAGWNMDRRQPNTTHYIVASSMAEITFAFKKKGNHAALSFTSLQGQGHEPKQLPVEEFSYLFGVSIYSHALPILFQMPAHCVNNVFLSLDTFLGKDANELTEKIVLASTMEERIDIVTSCFKLRLNLNREKDLLIRKAIQLIRKHNGNERIVKLACASFLSQKQFERRFTVFSGFSPKLYSRIVRFESLIRQYSHTKSFTTLAYDNGYYDQAHLNREFKAFTGFCPTDFWKLGTE